MILLGEAKERMNRDLGELTDTVMAKTMEEAVSSPVKRPGEEKWFSCHRAAPVSICLEDYKERGKVF